MNTKYAKIVNGQLTYAPNTLVTKTGALILNPKRLSYLQAGYKTLVDDPPTAPSGQCAALTRYDETSETITAIYKFVAAETAPRVFSKFRLVAALEARNLWQPFRDWLVETSYYDLFLAAQDIREDNPVFREALAATRARFALDSDELAAILAESVADES